MNDHRFVCAWRVTCLATVVLLAMAPASLAQSVVTSEATRTDDATGSRARFRADTLSLAHALALATQYAPAWQSAEAEAGVAIGDLRTTGQWPNPVLEYRRENLGAPLDPDEFVTAYIPIDVTGRRLHLRRATARGLGRVEAEREAAVRTLELELARAWFSAVLAADLSRVTRAQYDAVQRIADIDDARAREGVIAEAVALRTRVEAMRIAHELALSEAHAYRARQMLAVLVGLPEAALPPLPDVYGSTAFPALDERDWDDTDALIQEAEASRAELRAVAFAREEAASRRRVESAGMLGDWQLQGGTKRTSGFMSGQVGLAVPLPLFNSNSGARQRSTFALQLADASLRAMQLQVRSEVLAAVDQLRRLHELSSRIRESPSLGDDIAASARVAYAEGHMTLVELLDAERAAADARRGTRTFIVDLELARLTLRRAVGAPLAVGSTP